jgi:hypothetical protein
MAAGKCIVFDIVMFTILGMPQEDKISETNRSATIHRM